MSLVCFGVCKHLPKCVFARIVSVCPSLSLPYHVSMARDSNGFKWVSEFANMRENDLQREASFAVQDTVLQVFVG